MDKPRRVVVTGMGVITPLGNDLAAFWEGLLEGKPGASRVTRFDASAYPTQIACEIKDFDPSSYLERKELRRIARSVRP